MTQPQPKAASVIKVTDRNGNKHELEAVEGWRVMEILRDYRMGIEGICGGSLDCASCHVIIDPKWADRLHPPREDEIDAMDELPLVEPTSRLSCQILWSDDLDGLELTIPQEV
ncbi:2Fe-2S iron-sulfur cluster-binding protein [Mangrovicella endophytica]|uniref:2Fe-2S iron-sulfur cluster-binding protein n=1 Tax=Mangrovicella endophytica TaxID=2066697 RepID=UPI000C9E8176|nr:2Fe-2S iron-sulfur cluster-binding protein [Mangrovicella endophytica]